MEEILDLIATDAKATEVTDKIKDVLYTKSAEKIDAMKPNIAMSMFDPAIPDEPEVPEVEQEVSDEPAEQEES